MMNGGSSGEPSTGARVRPEGAGRIELFLLGGIELRGVDLHEADRLLAQPKLGALLALLALSPEQRPQRRDRIVGMLWPELDQARARSALRKAVHALRRTLGSENLRNRGDEEIWLVMPPVWCDAAELGVAADAGRMLRVVELYRDELMPGFHVAGCGEFQRWLDEERATARERASAAAWGLACTLENDEHLTDAGLMARKAVRYSTDDERVLRRTLAMLARIGDYAGAIKLYESFAVRMRAEFDAVPAPETVAMARSLRERGPGDQGLSPR